MVVAGGAAWEACVGVLSFGGKGEHEVGAGEEVLLVAIADLAAAAIASFPHLVEWPTERAEWFERIAHTDPLTGPRQRAHRSRRVLELEVARAQRQGSEVSVALFDVDGFTRAQRGRRVARRGPGPAPGRGGARGERPARRHDRPDRRRRVRARRARVRGRDGRPPGAGRHRRARGRSRATRSRVSAGIARFPQDGPDAESLLEAARAALASAGGGASISEAVGEPSA